MTIQQLLLAMGGGTGAFAADAADFDGTNDYLRRNSLLTGQANSKTGVFSSWVYVDSLANGPTLFVAFDPVNGFGIFSVGITVFGRVSVTGTSTTQVVIDLLSETIYSTGAWIHILCGWDAENADAYLYVNDVLEDSGVEVNDNVTFGGATDLYVAATDSLNLADAGLAETYLAVGQYLDFSVEANRRKFISSEGKPVDLGSTGASPTGTEPLIYLHLDAGESAANFAINRAGKGNFTVTGALTTRASSPSD